VNDAKRGLELDILCVRSALAKKVSAVRQRCLRLIEIYFHNISVLKDISRPTCCEHIICSRLTISKPGVAITPSAYGVSLIHLVPASLVVHSLPEAIMSDSSSVVSEGTIVNTSQPQSSVGDPSSIIDHAIEKLTIHLNATTKNRNKVKQNNDSKWIDMARTDLHRQWSSEREKEEGYLAILRNRRGEAWKDTVDETDDLILYLEEYKKMATAELANI
jgi:hypothetical protein